MVLEQYSMKVKICLIGDSSVGKTCLVRRYVLDLFTDNYISTLGTKVSKKQITLKIDNKIINLVLAIWDVLGQDYIETLHSKAFTGAKGAMLVCDLTREDTLKNILTWEARLKEITGKIPLILLANKSDLTSDYEFTQDDLLLFSSKLLAPSFMTSARFGYNVNNTFYKIGDLIANKMLNGLNEDSK